jgi:hypothetical protein
MGSNGMGRGNLESGLLSVFCERLMRREPKSLIVYSDISRRIEDALAMGLGIVVVVLSSCLVRLVK